MITSMAATAFEQVAYDLVPKSRLGSLFKDETGGGGGEGRNRFRLSPPLPLFFSSNLGTRSGIRVLPHN